MKLIAQLTPGSRRGTLTVSDAFGDIYTCPCLGKADPAGGAAHGNPQCDPLLPYGDTPAGTYEVVTGVRLDPPRSYGTSPVLALLPTSGQALQAATRGKRSGLLIHSGDPAADGTLRVTHGCLRVSAIDHARLVMFVRGSQERVPLEVRVQ